jgi:hypothetical protein
MSGVGLKKVSLIAPGLLKLSPRIGDRLSNNIKQSQQARDRELTVLPPATGVGADIDSGDRGDSVVTVAIVVIVVTVVARGGGDSGSSGDTLGHHCHLSHCHLTVRNDSGDNGDSGHNDDW